MSFGRSEVLETQNSYLVAGARLGLGPSRSTHQLFCRETRTLRGNDPPRTDRSHVERESVYFYTRRVTNVPGIQIDKYIQYTNK